ncbi:hypothetical protein OG819_55245 [Streptomyces sp. NBC_01549]|uniref:hypothetical protein n=1 Tax=Streptomyces sp. NBC_01549 TaxID=2975874 RepID=UPI002252C720|nr:hypothetical protein [Streptomyces sp. NBC_01549]MCX4598315.1 hypothetical protein [Streptomyces sp. NBC_01549]
MTKAPTHYMVSMPDGTVPPTSGSTASFTTINLAEHVGQAVDHPTPGRPWYDEGPFSYFRTYSQRGVGEVLDRRGEWPVQWPVRLWIVEPLGETGNWDTKYHPYWVLCHQMRVVEETEIWRAFGHRGQRVLDLIDRQLPDLARQWAEEWQTDPDGTRQRYDAWTARVDDTRAMSNWVFWRACYSRREAAKEVALQLARAAAEQVATAAGVTEDAVVAISRRGECTTAAELLYDRLRRCDYEKGLRALLGGAGLEARQLAAV